MRRPSKREQAEWDRRLAEDGMVNIEPVEGGALSGGAAGVRVDPERLDEGAAYTRQAEAFLRQHRFANDFEREIWAAHCDGLTIRETADALGSYKRIVHETLQRLQSLCMASDVSLVTTKDFERWVKKVDAETFLTLAPEIMLRLAMAQRRQAMSKSSRGRRG